MKRYRHPAVKRAAKRRPGPITPELKAAILEGLEDVRKGWLYHWNRRTGRFEADFDACARIARNNALEEAARLADEYPVYAEDIAAAIRRLKTP